MAYYFRLTPQAVDELTLDEFDAFAAWIDRSLAQQQTGGE